MLCPLRQKRTHKRRSGRKQQARGRPARSGTVSRLRWDYTGQLSGVAGYPASEKWSPVRVLTPGAEAGAAFRHPDSDTCWEQLDLRSDAATADGPTWPPRLQIMWHFLCNQSGSRRSKTSKSLTWQTPALGLGLQKAFDVSRTLLSVSLQPDMCVHSI